MKTKFLSIIFLLLPVLLYSCKETDEPTVDTFSGITNGAYILSQGNFYSGIEGSFNAIDLDKKEGFTNIFFEANGRYLGNTPSCGIATDDYIILGVQYSNTIEIINRATYNSVMKISLTNPAYGTQPVCMIKDKNYVYISMFDGYVARLNISTLQLDKAVKVGPNPEQIAFHNGKIYVPNSDGMNYLVGYGTTASIINPETFEVEKTITVPLNPYKFISSGDRLFLIAKGDYGTVPSLLYEINKDYSATEITNATHAAILGNTIYILYTPFIEGGVEVKYMKYDIASSKVSELNFITNGLDYPSGIAADPATGNIIIGYEIFDGIYPSYTLPGYAVVFNADGTHSFKYPIGAGTPCIFFPR